MELRTPQTFVSKTRRYSPSVACSSGPFHSTPALLNAISSRPNFSTVKSTIALTSASLAISARTNAASPPSFSICLTTSVPSFSRRPETTTFAPARANAIAVALPMPDVAPVTRATLPANVLLLFTAFLSFLFSNLCDSSIDEQFHAGDVAGVVRRSEHDSLRDFIRGAEPAEGHGLRNHLFALLAGFGRCVEFPQSRRVCCTRTDHIHA